MLAYRGLLGIAVLLLVAWALSSDRRRFPLKTVAGGMALQVVLAMFILRTAVGRDALNAVGSVVALVLSATTEGARFMFGELVVANDQWGFVFAAVALPPIIVFSSLSAIGYHLGVLQRIVQMMAAVMVRLMGVSGAEGLSAAGNVFLGQTEAPLLVRPYIPKMTQSELMALMVGGFATIASGVMAAYVAILAGGDEARQVQITSHFLTASLMSAPGSFVLAKIMVPETEKPQTIGTVRMTVEKQTRNIVHAAANGASDGMKLALNVAAMLIAFVALIKIIDKLLVVLGERSFMEPVVAGLGFEQLDLASLLGMLFSPIAWLIGVDWTEARLFGSLLGTAMATNEMVAYTALAGQAAEQAVSERTIRLATYSICGFANFSSIAIQIGGIGAIAPDRRADLARLGPRAMLAGAMACWMTGCIAGTLTGA